MALNSLSGADAKRYVLIGRTAAVALGVTAVALWALDVPGMGSLPEKPTPREDVGGASQPVAAKPTPKLEPEALADAAERLDIAVVKDKKPVAEAPKTEPAPPPPSAGPEWAYLGAIFEATRTLAVVSVDGHQKVLAEGRKYGDTTLVKVGPDHIVINGPGGKQEIEKKSRGAASPVAWLRNMPTNAAPVTAGIAGQPGNGGMTPEVAARLRERGINPEQASSFRQQMRDRRSRGRAEGGNGGANGGNPVMLNLPAGAVPGVTGTRTIRGANDTTITVPTATEDATTVNEAGEAVGKGASN